MRFKVGAYAKYHTVFIKSGAHANILAQPKHFAHFPNQLIAFSDNDSSYITLRTHEKSVDSLFFNGTQITRGMPVDYTAYTLQILKDVKVDKNHINAMFQWTQAKSLKITDENVVAFELQKRSNKLKELGKLEKVFFDISYRTYMKLRVKTFVDSLKSLKKITFRAQAISLGQFGMFVKSQTVPIGWTCKSSTKVVYIYDCMKNWGNRRKPVDHLFPNKLPILIIKWTNVWRNVV